MRTLVIFLLLGKVEAILHFTALCYMLIVLHYLSVKTVSSMLLTGILIHLLEVRIIALVNLFTVYINI